MLCRRFGLQRRAAVAPWLPQYRQITTAGATLSTPPATTATTSSGTNSSDNLTSTTAQQADLLFDVLGSAVANPEPHHRDTQRGRVKDGDSDNGGSAPWSQHIRQVVREAVLNPLRKEEEKEKSSESNRITAHPLSSSSSPHVDSSAYKVMVVDALGMPASLPTDAPRTFADLLALSPEILRLQLQQLMDRRHYHALTAVQGAAIPLMLEYRDVLCIAPTATGKTLCYVFASMLRLLLSDAHGRTSSDGEETNLNRRQVETFLRDKIDRGEVCPYCELSTVDTRVCPMTGFPHVEPSDVATDLELRSKERRAMRLEELRASVAEPRVLVLVPNSELVHQVSAIYRSLRCDYRVHFMVRASSAEEQRRHLQALEGGVDVLVCSPETILPAMYKHKLSLKRVQTVVMDEVDDMVSVNHFEPLKIILGALPKGALRPQRLLLGASLPPVAYEMIKSRMLLPSHRFVLVDLKAPGALATTPLPISGAPSVEGVLTARANLRHLVFLLGRCEKVQKLAWLYHTGKLSTDQRTIIFCNSRHNVAYLHDKLKELVPELNVTTLTSQASSTAREGVMKMFRTGVSTCLVCTDLLSRGVDIQKVVYVVHYDMAADMETWMHRCGRCGRGGALQGQGYVYTFFQPENVRLAKPLVAYLRQQKQLIPPKLQEYAKQSFIDVFNNSLFHHPTRPYRKDDPQHSTSALGRGTRRFPDYKQGATNKHFRPH